MFQASELASWFACAFAFALVSTWKRAALLASTGGDGAAFLALIWETAGFVFRDGACGLGYYRDNIPATTAAGEEEDKNKFDGVLPTNTETGTKSG